MANWYAVYTRPRYEKKVAENFAKRRIESYCPMNNSARQWGTRKVSQAPLFPSYVFARLDEIQLNDVRKTDGVINLAYWLSSPIIIRDIEIEMMKRFLEEHENVGWEAIPVDPKAIVKISYDNAGDEQAFFKQATTVRLLLPSLGRALIANIKKDHVKVITEYNFSEQLNLSF